MFPEKYIGALVIRPTAILSVVLSYKWIQTGATHQTWSIITDVWNRDYPSPVSRSDENAKGINMMHCW